MTLDEHIISNYLKILKEELVPAMGCTEPIAIAYAAAKAREVLGAFPERCIVSCSGNVIKNVRSVIIPGTQGQVGIEAAVWAGIVSGRADLQLEVLSLMTPEDADQVKQQRSLGMCEIKLLKSDSPLHITILAMAGDQSALVEIKQSHTHIVRIQKNNMTIFESSHTGDRYLGALTDRSLLNVDDIYLFADTVDLELVQDLLQEQIRCNMAIAEEGIQGTYGVGIGQMMLQSDPSQSVSTSMKAYAAAASEARMCGSLAPVITNSGSGNQGIASSVPVIMFARRMQIEERHLLRALILSNLLTIHQKTRVGRLSAFCSMVLSASASGAAMTYLQGGSLDQIKMTIANTLANTTGVICDGAKPACGAKISASLDAAYIGHKLAMDGRSYSPGDGILKNGIEETIAVVGSIAHEGMRETEGHILGLMLQGC